MKTIFNYNTIQSEMYATVLNNRIIAIAKTMGGSSVRYLTISLTQWNLVTTDDLKKPVACVLMVTSRRI